MATEDYKRGYMDALDDCIAILMAILAQRNRERRRPKARSYAARRGAPGRA